MLRAYPNKLIVMRTSVKFEAKAAGQKGSEACFLYVDNVFVLTTQVSDFAAEQNRADYFDRLLILFFRLT